MWKSENKYKIKDTDANINYVHNFILNCSSIVTFSETHVKIIYLKEKGSGVYLNKAIYNNNNKFLKKLAYLIIVETVIRK